MHFTSRGQVRPLEVIPMFARLPTRLIIFTLLASSAAPPNLPAQDPSMGSAAGAAPVTQATANSAAPAPNTGQVAVPMGTRLPLLLRNGINTRTAKAGDSVYFETAYPIAVNNKIAIPLGTFVRGQILEAKRPGRIKGRGEFRIALEQMIYPNGYTIELRATPSSVDRDGQEGVDREGKIKGPSSKGRDTATVLVPAVAAPILALLPAESSMTYPVPEH